MRAMLEFLYTGKYTLALDEKIDEYAIRSLLLAGELCLAAKKYNVEGLYELAKARMKRIADQSL